ncbi:MAG: lipoyl(octanoyl) transferase LipB [bacterium]
MENQFTSKTLDYCNLGLIDYKKAWDLQHNVFAKRVDNKINDTFFMLEHPNTYTLGKVASKDNLIGSEEYLKSKGISVYEIDRGGDITYHGPGQIVGYPIIDLKNWKQDTHLYLRNLEEVIIQVCNNYGLIAGRKKEYTGVWIGEKKICAIGIKISRWVTMHGFAFNVNTDLKLFDGIVPCGIKDKEVTSLSKELNRNLDIEEVKRKILEKFIKMFEYNEFNITNPDVYNLENNN